MAVGTLLGFARPPAADGVRHVGAERRAAEALRRDRLLLDVDRLAVAVVAADVDGATRPGRVDAVAGHVAVAGQHVHIIPQGLEVVRGEVALHVAVGVQVRGLDVRPLRQVAADATRVPRRVAGDAAHVVAAVGGTLLPAGRQVAPDGLAVLDADGFRQGRLFVVPRVALLDRVARLDHLPLKPFLDTRVLEVPLTPLGAVADLEAGGTEGRLEREQVAALAVGRGRVTRGAGGLQSRVLFRRTVAVDAGDFGPRPDFHLQSVVAVHVLDEVAVDAVHPLLHVDVHEVDGVARAARRDLVLGLPRRQGAGHGVVEALLAVKLAVAVGPVDRRGQLRGTRGADGVAGVVAQFADAVLLEDRAEGPAVAVEVGEVLLRQLRVQLREFRDELRVRQLAPRRRLVRVSGQRADQLVGRGVVLLRRVHQRGLGLLVVPHVAEVTVHHGRAGVDVANHALTGGDGVGELVGDGVARLVLGDRRVGRGGRPAVAVLGVRAGVDAGAVVGVNDVARRAAATAVVAGVVVGAEEVQRRVEQSRLVQTHQHRVGAVARTEAAETQAGPRASGFFEALGDADFRGEAAARLEDPQHVARLRRLEARQRLEVRHDALLVDLLLRRRRVGLQPQRCPPRPVSLAVAGALVGHGAVVVQGRAPQHAAGAHELLAVGLHLLGVAPGRAATDVGDPEVPRIHEPHELRRLVVQERVTAHRVRRTRPHLRVHRGDVRPADVRRRGVAAVAVGATDAQGRLAVRVTHRLVAQDTADRLGVGLGGGLLHQLQVGELRRHRVRVGRVGGPLRVVEVARRVAERQQPAGGEVLGDARQRVGGVVRRGTQREGQCQQRRQREGQDAGDGQRAGGCHRFILSRVPDRRSAQRPLYPDPGTGVNPTTRR